jgi:hypothetical protein
MSRSNFSLPTTSGPLPVIGSLCCLGSVDLTTQVTAHKTCHFLVTAIPKPKLILAANAIVRCRVRTEEVNAARLDLDGCSNLSTVTPHSLTSCPNALSLRPQVALSVKPQVTRPGPQLSSELPTTLLRAVNSPGFNVRLKRASTDCSHKGLNSCL